MAAITSLVLAGISLVLSVVQMILAKKPKGPDMSGVEARKGYEMVVEGKPDNLALVYGRAKVGGIRVFHETSGTFDYVESNADKSFVSGVQSNTTGSILVGKYNNITKSYEGITKNWTNKTNTQLDEDLTGKRNEFLFFQQALCLGEINGVYDVIIDDSKYLSDPSLGTFGSPQYSNNYDNSDSPETKKWDNPKYPRSAYRIDVHHSSAQREIEPDVLVDGGYEKADSIFAANFSDRKDAIFKGMTYASCVFRLDKDDPQFSQVPNLQFLVEGRKVREIIKTGDQYALSTPKVYTNNPAYCLLDYLTDSVAGAGIDIDEEIDLTTFYHAAQICNTPVKMDAEAGGHIWKPIDGSRNGDDRNIGKRNVPLYECNILIDTNKAIRDNVEEILATMSDARLIWARGKYSLLLEYVNNATDDLIPPADIELHTLTDDDIVLDQDIEIAYPSASNRYNYCTIKFHNESNDFKDDAVSWPHKINDTTLRGYGGIKYPIADFTWKDEGGARKLLNKYGVWNGTLNNTTLTYYIIRNFVAGDENKSHFYDLEFAADDAAVITIYDGATNNIIVGPITTSFQEGTFVQKVKDINLPPFRTQFDPIASEGGDDVYTIIPNHYYKVIITAGNTKEEKGVSAALKQSVGTEILWTTREIAYQGVQQLDYTNTTYLQMKEEDNGIALELETSYAGITDYYHALAKAEELVKTSRTAYTIKFKYVVREKYFEPGDYFIINSETLGIMSTSANVPIGEKHNYFRINSVKISEDNTCEVNAQRFHWSQLAWMDKENEYLRPINKYATVIAAPTDVHLIKEAYNENSLGVLKWSAAEEVDLINYVIYIYEGSDIDSISPPVFNEIGRTIIGEFVLPLLNISSAIFAVRTQTRTGFSPYAYSSTVEAEMFDNAVYTYPGFSISNVSNVISWTAFSVYKDSIKLGDVAAGSHTALTQEGILYIYYDNGMLFSYDVNAFRNKRLVATYEHGVVIKPIKVQIYPPTSLKVTGSSDTTFNTKDVEISWENLSVQPVKPSKYLVQILSLADDLKKSYTISLTSFKLTKEMNVEIFGTATRSFKIKIYGIDAANNATTGYLSATLSNNEPSSLDLTITKGITSSIVQSEIDSDKDIIKYVFKQYTSASAIVAGEEIESTSNYAVFNTEANTNYWYTVTVYDDYGVGTESDKLLSKSGGINSDSIFLYKRSTATTISVPSTTLSYTFSTKALAGALDGWSTSIPTGTDQLYMTMASVISISDIDDILATEWATPVKYETGFVSFRSAIVPAYQRSVDVLTSNPGIVTYDFTTNSITTEALANGWQKTIPSGNDPLYITTAIANSKETTDSIAASEWSTPVVLSKDGQKGQGKVKGISFCRHTAAPNPPASTDGTFSAPNATGVITVGSPAVAVTGVTWSDGIPPGESQLYMTTRLFTSDAVGQGDWTTPVAISKTGPGSKIRYIFSSSTSATAPALPSTNITADTTDWKLTGASDSRWMSVQVNTLDATNTIVSSYGAWSTAALIKGEKGDTGLSAVLSNQYQGIPCNAAGTPLTGAFNTATTTMRVYKGSTEITSLCTFSVTKTDVTCTEATTSRTQTVTAIAANTGSVKITATETATNLTVDAVFSLAKQLQGPQGDYANGTDAVLYEVSANSPTTVKSLAGTYSPTTIVFSSFRTVGNSGKSAYSAYWRVYIDGVETEVVTDAQATATTTRTVTVSGASTVAVKAYWHPYRTDPYFLDMDTTTIVPAGPKGADSTVQGPNGAGSLVVYKAGTMASYPAKPTGLSYAASTTEYTTGWKIASANVTLGSGEILFQCDGSYVAGGTTITWTEVYPSLLKVGTLDAITVITGNLKSASTGRRLTINDSNEHEFRCLDASGNQVATMGDDGSTSAEEIFRADLRYTQTYGQANSASTAFNAEMPGSLTGRGANYTSTGFQATTTDSDANNNPRLFGAIGRMRANSVGTVDTGYGALFLSSIKDATKMKRAYLAMEESGFDCGAYIDYRIRYPIIGQFMARTDVTLSTSTSAGLFRYLSYRDRPPGSFPGWDAYNEVTLADATYAVNATGSMKTNSSMTAASYVTSSDERLKDNLVPIPNALDKISTLTGYTFTWNDLSKRHETAIKNDVGLIAQQVKEVLPEAVFEDEENYLQLDYTSIIPLLVNAINELKAEVDNLKGKL
jgi:hypothetical protein